MKQFEYKLETNNRLSEKCLNELGEEGWELIGITNNTLFLKREITDEIRKELDKRKSRFLDKPISEFSGWISVRAMNVLSEAGIETPRQLIKTKRSSLLKFRNFGKKSLTELDEFLDHFGYYFGKDLNNYGTENN